MLMSQATACPSPFQPCSPNPVYFQLFGDTLMSSRKHTFHDCLRASTFLFYVCFGGTLLEVGKMSCEILKTYQQVGLLSRAGSLGTVRSHHDALWGEDTCGKGLGQAGACGVKE